MSKFLTKLRVERVEEPKTFFGRATWKLLEPLEYKSGLVDTTIIVNTGFKTDFASVPRLFLVYALVGDTGHASAVVHDYLCHLKFFSRRITDRIFLEALEVEGVPAWRRYIMYAGVRIGSRF